MPHVNDKHAFNDTVKLLGGPCPLHYSARVSGRRVIDTPQVGQKHFQGILAHCLFSERRTTPWDVMAGRSFHDLRSYFNSISPQLDSLMIETNTAMRVASYLLPYTRSYSRSLHECSGIPGLRVDGYGKGMIRLRHLPTNGILELRDSRSYTKQLAVSVFQREVAWNRELDVCSSLRVPAWEKDSLDIAEEASLRAWPSVSEVSLLSAILARAGVLWGYSWDNGLLAAAYRPSAAYCLSWYEGPTTNKLGQLLSESAIRVDGMTFKPSECVTGRGLLLLGEVELELSGSKPPIFE